MPDYFSLQNFYADVNPPTKKQEAFAKELSNNNEAARSHNDAIKNSKSITGPLKRFCPLDESILKTDKV
jgi:hypothetical protein